MAPSIPMSRISEMVQYLHARLPKPPTAIKARYELPSFLGNEPQTAEIHPQHLQRLSDDIGYFLGLLKSVPVRVVDEPTGGNWAGRSGEGIVYQPEGSPVGGCFWVTGGELREILVFRKQHFVWRQFFAIVAHECTHNYLYQHRIEWRNPQESEPFTDVCSAYVGLGGLLLRGYGTQLGYLPLDRVRDAIYYSAMQRGLRDLGEDLYGLPRILVNLCAWRHDRKRQRLAVQLKALHVQVQELRGSLQRIATTMSRVSQGSDHPALSVEDGTKLVEIANALAIGETERKVDTLLRDTLLAEEDDEVDSVILQALTERTHTLSHQLQKWDQVVQRLERSIGPP